MSGPNTGGRWLGVTGSAEGALRPAAEYGARAAHAAPRTEPDGIPPVFAPRGMLRAAAPLTAPAEPGTLMPVHAPSRRAGRDEEAEPAPGALRPLPERCDAEASRPSRALETSAPQAPRRPTRTPPSMTLDRLIAARRR